MEKEGGNSRKRLFLMFSACVAFFCVCLILIFTWYREKLDAQFYQMLQKTLTSYADGQRQEIQLTIRNLEGTLRAVDALLETSGIDPKRPEMTRYLQALGERESGYGVTYLGMDSLRGALPAGGAGTNSGDRDMCDRLEKGETVVSDIHLSRRTGDRHFFSVSVPVMRAGQTVGVLRSLLGADTLIRTMQSSPLHNQVESYIVLGNGDFVAVRDGETAGETNLLRFGGLGAVDPADVTLLQKMLEEDRNATCHLHVKVGPDYLVALSSLGYNDWHIVSFARADKIGYRSKLILWDTITASLLIMALTALAGAFLYWQIRAQRRALDFECARYGILANFSDTVLFEYEYRTDTMEFTPNARQLLHLKELRLKAFTENGCGGLIDPEEVRDVVAILRAAVPTDGVNSRELRLLGRDGTYFWCLCQYQAVRDDGGAAVTLLGKLVDISRLKERERGLIQKSELDAQTGLLNKATVTGRIDRYLRQEGARGFLLMMDIDNFKQINDNRGHQAGDEAISRIGDVLRNVFRERDLLGRVGGDEFVVFMADTADRAAAARKGKTLLEQISAVDEANAFTCSVGIAPCPEMGADFATLYRAADRAMYEAKRDGKHTYRFAADLDGETGGE